MPAARVAAATPRGGDNCSAACGRVRASASTTATLRAGRACRDQAKSKSGWNCHLDELHDRLHRVARCTRERHTTSYFCKHLANLSISKRLETADLTHGIPNGCLRERSLVLWRRLPTAVYACRARPDSLFSARSAAVTPRNCASSKSDKPLRSECAK